ncbi:hypothetical protein ACS0TY_011074 [Phlomoides rotata]
MALLHDRYITACKPYNSGRPSSIGPGIHRHLGRLAAGSRWIVGHSSRISLWNDNWLGYIISERIDIPRSFVVGLSSTIQDFFYDECWHFDYEFFMKHTDIVRDILSIHVFRGSDSRVWGNSVTGMLTSRMAYDLLRSPNPRVNWASWIWDTSYPPVVPPSSGGLIGASSPLQTSFATLATRFQTCKQVGCLWRSAIITTF